MVIKCVVSRCNFNYDKDKKTTASLLGFPKHGFDTERRRKQGIIGKHVKNILFSFAKNISDLRIL